MIRSHVRTQTDHKPVAGITAEAVLFLPGFAANRAEAALWTGSPLNIAAG